MCLTLKQEYISDDKPSVPVMLVSGEAAFAISALESLGVRVIPTNRNDDIAGPVSWHPDMQFFFFPDGKAVTLLGNAIPDVLTQAGYPMLFTSKKPDRRYPGDVLCNALYHAGAIYAKLDALDTELLALAYGEALDLVSVRQGYTACSVCVVNDEAVITADTGLAAAFRTRGTDVLEINAGHIRLLGYDYGFIGGCCGKLDERTLVFTGRLDSHPDGGRIRRFICHYGLDVLELTTGPLMDIGGMMNISRRFYKENG